MPIDLNEITIEEIAIVLNDIYRNEREEQLLYRELVQMLDEGVKNRLRESLCGD